MKAFWRWLTTSRYTRRLEDENEELKAKITAYESILMPRLKIQAHENGAGPERVGPASASFGRNLPIKPQKLKRTNWTEARNKLELLTNTSIQTEQRMQKAVNAHKDL